MAPSEILTMMKWGGVDYSSDFAPYGLHRPIAIDSDACPRDEVENHLFKSLAVVELNLFKDKERYLYEHTTTKGNTKTNKNIARAIY